MIGNRVGAKGGRKDQSRVSLLVVQIQIDVDQVLIVKHDPFPTFVGDFGAAVVGTRLFCFDPNLFRSFSSSTCFFHANESLSCTLSYQ